MLLGDFVVKCDPFPGKTKAFLEFRSKAFTEQSIRKKFDIVNERLLSLIQEAKEPCFLLSSVVDYIAAINKEDILLEPYRLLDFEFWLGHYSGLSEDENRHIRCKIVGKKIDRQEYQLLFPIGMNTTLAGSHFVAAHLSPDVDTTIASFWGWVDAFGAKVSASLHQWALPDRVTDSHTKMLFESLFGEEVFDIVARKSATLTMSALDIVSSHDLVKVNLDTHLSHIHTGKRIAVVDSTGHFKGDWRASDAEAVRQVVNAFYSLIRWLEHAIYYQLISSYAKEKVLKKDIKKSLDTLFSTKLKESDPAKEYTENQKMQIEAFLQKVLLLKKGLSSTYQELCLALGKAAAIKMPSSEFAPDAIFAKNGTLKEDRPTIFKHLEILFRQIADTSSHCRHFLDRFDVLLAIKDQVLKIESSFITLSSEIEEIRTKMNSLEYLTVAIPEEDGKWFPVGVVFANDIKRKRLGTVSLRDFSNEGETKMASYLDVVSVIDHHKTDIKTSSASTIIVGDAQSANTLVAELAIEINKRYSTLGLAADEILKEQENKHSLSKQKRLLDLALNLEKQQSYYIHPAREYSEYLLFLLAILDDTDLLTKVSKRDLTVIKNLLNRMKTIASKKDAEIIHTASQEAILQNEDMYSIYKKIYAHKEKEMETNLTRCLKGESSTIFSDTKEQNGCARIGQTKLFSKNYPTFAKNASTFQSLWLEMAKKIYEQRPQIDLHMQMITTIASADEVYQGKTGNWKHQDELWLWAAPSQVGAQHLVNFLNAFIQCPVIQQNEMQVDFLGKNAQELDLIFSQNFPKASRTRHSEQDLPIAVLRFKAGILNSRKAFITPYLPRLIT